MNTDYQTKINVLLAIIPIIESPKELTRRAKPFLFGDLHRKFVHSTLTEIKENSSSEEGFVQGCKKAFPEIYQSRQS